MITSVPVFPAPSVAVIVIVLVPATRPMFAVHVDQLPPEVSVAAPPVAASAFVQATEITATLSPAVPPTGSGVVPEVNVPRLVGLVIVIVGGVVSITRSVTVTVISSRPTRAPSSAERRRT